MLKTPRQYGRPIPEAVNRRAERRWAQRPFAKGARTPAKACTLPGANRRSAPSTYEGTKARLAKAGNTTATAAPTKGRGGFRMAV